MTFRGLFKFFLKSTEIHALNTLRCCYGCDHLLEIETLNRLLWFRFETWLRFRVAIRIATLITTLIATLVETLVETMFVTTVPERFRVAKLQSKPCSQPCSQP